ncbi:MAG: hypothetical protein KAJ54_02465 [Candidatus Aenigmarchaeota archaeon]|nr:hypothetical protein [Candidatus Aenigmarchaeota archaeon]
MTQYETIPKGLSAARNYALKGDAPTMECYLNVVETYAKITNQDISKQVAEIKALISD